MLCLKKNIGYQPMVLLTLLYSGLTLLIFEVKNIDFKLFIH